ncbi:hypothetical protein LIA77_04713 [Sarocladium implicatum]|nr:hypothetical protein LIA77_04713 [Sarocladium implicatum]
MSSEDMARPSSSYRSSTASSGPWNAANRSSYSEVYGGGSGYNSSTYYAVPASSTPYTNGTAFAPIAASSNSMPVSRPEIVYATGPYSSRPVSGAYPSGYHVYKQGRAPTWDSQDRHSPTDSVDDILASPNLSDYSLDNGPQAVGGKGGSNGKTRSQRRPSNRDEFDGPHQFLPRPAPEIIALQERELPHLPTNLLVQEQDEILGKVNDRLSQCAFDFVAKYQFPIPLTQDMRPVERPQDREWTEWVYLLKRLATKRRIPARVLYNGQIKQFVTILENSLEMRHAAKHQSRPPKDDRNILQLISAGIQVAKILKDASAMDYLDQLYVFTEQQINDRMIHRQHR